MLLLLLFLVLRRRRWQLPWQLPASYFSCDTKTCWLQLEAHAVNVNRNVNRNVSGSVRV
jgi:hypothetical protein